MKRPPAPERLLGQAHPLSPRAISRKVVLDYLGYYERFRGLMHEMDYAIVGAGVTQVIGREGRADAHPWLFGALTVILVTLAAAIGTAIHWTAVTVPFGWFFELLVMTTLIAQRSLYDHVARVRAALDDDGLAGFLISDIGNNADPANFHFGANVHVLVQASRLVDPCGTLHAARLLQRLVDELVADGFQTRFRCGGRAHLRRMVGVRAPRRRQRGGADRKRGGESGAHASS